MRGIKYLVLFCSIVFASEARSQGYTVKSLDCAKIVQTLTTKVGEMVLAVDIADPAQIQSDAGLASFLDTAFKDAVQTCKTRGITTASWIEISISTGDVSFYRGEMSAQTRQWKALGDGRAWQIPAILKKRQYEQNMREAIAKEPASSTTQEQFCANFVKHRAVVTNLLAQRKSEQNPLRAQAIDQQINDAARAASAELSNLYGTGIKRFASYTGRLTSLSDAGSGIRMSVAVDCAAMPIVFNALFSNSAATDPNPGDSLSSLPMFRATLTQLNQGDRVQVDGVFRGFLVGVMNPGAISLTDDPLTLSVRITQLTRLSK